MLTTCAAGARDDENVKSNVYCIYPFEVCFDITYPEVRLNDNRHARSHGNTVVNAS